MSRPANAQDPSTLPPKLRRPYETARTLARLKAERALWANTLKALGAKPESPAAKKE